MVILKIIGFLLKWIGILLLAVLVLLLAALCVPVHLWVRVEPEVAFGVRWLFLRFEIIGGEEKTPAPPGPVKRFLLRLWEGVRLVLALLVWGISEAVGAVRRFLAWVGARLPKIPKKKRAAPQKPPEPEEPEPSFFASLREERGFFGALRFFVDLGRALGGLMVKIYGGVRVDEFRLRMSVAGEDAADTAVKYGRICVGVFPALSFLLGATRGFSPLRQDIEVTPDYAGEGIAVTFRGAFTVWPIVVVGRLLWVLLRFGTAQLRITFQNRKTSAD